MSQSAFTFEQELFCLAKHTLVEFKNKMYHIYGVEFDSVESQRIQELMLDFYKEAEKLKNAQRK